MFFGFRGVKYLYAEGDIPSGLAEGVLEAKRRRISEAEDRARFHEEQGRLARAEVGILERENEYRLRLIGELERLREERLRSLEYYERRAGRLDIGVYEREVARRIAEDLRADLKRIEGSIRALRGWVTRKRREIAEARRRAGRHFYYLNYYRAVRLRWLTDLWVEELSDFYIPELEAGRLSKEREREIIARVREIIREREEARGEAEELRALAEARGWVKVRRLLERALDYLELLEALLRRVRELLKLEMVQRKMAFFVLVLGVKREYRKRFEAIYSVDTLWDRLTGEFREEDPLTLREVNACWMDFLARFNWSHIGWPPGGEEEESATLSAPAWMEEFWIIDEARGAFLYSLSVIEDGEETYYNEFDPPIPVYIPTEEEKRRFRERAMRRGEEAI